MSLQKIVLSFVVWLIAFPLFSQESLTTQPLNINAVTLDEIKSFAAPRDPITINSVSVDVSNAKGYRYFLNLTNKSGQKTQVDCSKGSVSMILPDINSLEDYWIMKNIQSLFVISKSRSVGKIRTDAEKEAIDAFEQLKPKVLDDAFLNDYLYGLFMEVYLKNKRPDAFNYDFTIIVIDELEPTANIYANGYLVISTGMLASLHTEDELVAVLARECNHFICNHYIENIATSLKKINIAAGADLAAAFLGLKGVALDIAELSIELGLNFDKKQEIDSDTTAVRVLSLLGYDPNGMATALTNMSKYYIEEGTLEKIYNPQGRFPSLEDRVSATGVPYERKDVEFEERVASCVSAVANARYNQGKSNLAISIIQENIDNDAASPSDYCLYGSSLMKIQDNDENSNKAVEAFQKSIDGNPDNIEAYKGLVMAYSRLKLFEDALRSLQDLRAVAGDDASVLSWIENTNRTLSRRMSAGTGR